MDIGTLFCASCRMKKFSELRTYWDAKRNVRRIRCVLLGAFLRALLRLITIFFFNACSRAAVDYTGERATCLFLAGR